MEWAHAIAPGANILLVETTSDRWSDLIAGVDYAKMQPGVSVVSMSWDVPEYRIETATDATFTTAANHPVTFVAAAGDYGSPPEVSRHVAECLGRRRHDASSRSRPGGGYGSETAWSDGGGGVSTVEKEPAYQDGAQNTGYRSDPDVAYDADPNTGVAVYDTVNDRYGTGWDEIGGTSAGAPQWSALLADRQRRAGGGRQSALDAAQARLYSLPANAYHDITTGNNGTYAAGVGYDAVTGLGTPVANVLIEDLINGTTGSPTGGVVTTIAAITRTGGSGGGGGGHGGHGGRGSRYDAVEIMQSLAQSLPSSSLAISTTSVSPQLSAAGLANLPAALLQTASADARAASNAGGGELAPLDLSEQTDDASAAVLLQACRGSPKRATPRPRIPLRQTPRRAANRPALPRR